MNTPSEKPDFHSRFNSFVGKIGMLTGILLFPIVFGKLLAFGELHPNESGDLFIGSLLLVGISLIFIIKKRTIHTVYSLLFFTLYLLISVELLTRVYIKITGSKETKTSLNEQCDWTYPDNIAYTGHPFLQFIGKPSVALKGNEALGNLSPFNNFGFVGPDFSYTKSPRVIRIACIGESTTADGYPAFLEHYLNAHRHSSGYRFEVMNFGHAYWTTSHSLVNFVLNICDFSPDYIVIHHGWNEEKIRNAAPSEFRGDYSNAFKVFSPPRVYDRYFIRLSALYRLFKFKYDKSPSWTSLGSYIQYKRKEVEPYFSNVTELKPFKRNIEDMIGIALMRNIKVVLTTLPHSTDPNIPMYYGFKSIDQCNEINREIKNEFKDKIYFVDLDSMVTGRHNEIFKDLGHINDEGRIIKSEAIGRVILTDTVTINDLISSRKDQPVNREDEITFYKARIRSSPDWLKDVERKAKERKISLDEMIRMDAVHGSARQH